MAKEIINPDTIQLATLAVKIGTPIVIVCVGMFRYIIKRTDNRIDGKADLNVLRERFKSDDEKYRQIEQRCTRMEGAQTKFESKFDEMYKMILDLWKAKNE